MSHRSDEALLDELRHIAKRAGKTPSRSHVMKTFTVGAGRASRLLRHLQAANTNGPAKQDELPLLTSVPDFFGDRLLDRCAKAAITASKQADVNSSVIDQYRAVARAVLIEAIQERG